MTPSPCLNFRSIPPTLRSGREADDDLTARRGMSPDASQPLSPIGGVPCLVVGDDNSRRIIHFHGGGYRMGSARGWRGFAERLAIAAGAQVIVPDYALAPEAPFPAALHDAVAVLQAVCASEGAVMLSGDSAGGGLALALATMVAAPTPLRGLMLFSPWIDLSPTRASYDRCASSDALFSRASATQAAEHYLQGHGADDPLVSPVLADLSTLPPVLLSVSSSEVLCDESLHLAARLTEAGLRTTVLVEPGMRHIWPVLSPDEPATARVMDQIAAFVSGVIATC